MSLAQYTFLILFNVFVKPFEAVVIVTLSYLNKIEQNIHSHQGSHTLDLHQ